MSLLHGDYIVSPLFLSLRRLDDLSGSTGSLHAGPSHHDSCRYLRFVVKGTYQFGVYYFGLTPSQQVLMRIMAPIPPSSNEWPIDSSWSLQNSSLVYLGVEFGLCPLWLVLLQTGQQSPATTRRFLSTTSSASLWRRTLGHLSSLNFHIPDGIFQMRMLQLFLEDQWDFLDDQF